MNIKNLYNIYKENPIICTDTRKIKKGSIFFALKGEKFNGNLFANKAIKEGCSYAIIDEKSNTKNKQFIRVKDSLKTLQELARYHRKKLSIPIIGITGTNGKTTSKELIHAVLKTKLNCYATKGNLNNHIGVPLSILEINHKHEIAIIEMGANHEKEIDFLCNITLPTHGTITNIGSAHLEGFKNIQGVINTKRELYNYIKKINGLLFINNDDKLLVNLSKNIKSVFYGVNSKLDVSITNNTPFLNLKWRNKNIQSKLIGEYQFYNISLAICIGNYFNISEENIKIAIESYIPKNNRSEIQKTNNNTIILDAYNANPSSMKAMLCSFAQQKYNTKMCILGDMLELGKHSKNLHQKMSTIINSTSIDKVNVFGKHIKETYKNIHIKKKGLILKEYSQIFDLIKNNINNNDYLMIKGSNSTGLFSLVNSLKKGNIHAL